MKMRCNVDATLIQMFKNLTLKTKIFWHHNFVILLFLASYHINVALHLFGVKLLSSRRKYFPHIFLDSFLSVLP